MFSVHIQIRINLKTTLFIARIFFFSSLRFRWPKTPFQCGRLAYPNKKNIRFQFNPGYGVDRASGYGLGIWRSQELSERNTVCYIFLDLCFALFFYSQSKCSNTFKVLWSRSLSHTIRQDLFTGRQRPSHIHIGWFMLREPSPIRAGLGRSITSHL